MYALIDGENINGAGGAAPHVKCSVADNYIEVIYCEGVGGVDAGSISTIKMSKDEA